jgi:hypothetical protein
MLLSVYGKRWREVQLAMLTVYVDDSGTAPDQHIAIATGLIIPAAVVPRLEAEWDSLKTKEGFSDFHTSEFVYKNPKSQFSGWDDVKRRRVYDRVRQIAKKYGLAAGSTAVNKQDYEEVLPKDFRNLVGANHYTWAVHHLLGFLQARRRIHHSACPAFEYVFDWMEPRSRERREIETAMARAEETAVEDGNDGEFSNYSFRYRKDIPGLQCVDCVSWVAYQFTLFSFRKKPIHPFAEIGWQDFGGPLDEYGWLGAITVERENLKKWYANVLADPRNLEKFTRIEQARLARNQPRPARSV